VAPPPPDGAEPAALPVVDRMALALRLAHGLAPQQLAEILEFIEDRRDGTLVMLKEQGQIVDIRAHRSRAVEARRAVR
jgi:hypothetical protein